MSYRNDPYDPKQAALLAPEALDAAVDEARKAFDAAGDLDALGALKPAYLGDRSPVSLARREIGSLPPAARSEAGKRGHHGREPLKAGVRVSPSPGEVGCERVTGPDDVYRARWLRAPGLTLLRDLSTGGLRPSRASVHCPMAHPV